MVIPEISVLFFEWDNMPYKKNVVEMLRRQKHSFRTDLSKISFCVKKVFDERDKVVSRNDIYEQIAEIRFNDENGKLNWDFGFIKVYTDNRNNMDQIIRSFWDKYHELSEQHDKDIEEYYGNCQFEYRPREVQEGDLFIENDGILLDIGKLSLLAYGAVPDVTFYLYDIVDAIVFVQQTYSDIKFEGAVSCEQCLDRAEIQVVGCVRDYSYTLKRILKESGFDKT